MAIDESKASAGVVSEKDAAVEDATAGERAPLSLDDLRRRLDSPLFARDPGLSAATVPHVRELTWEHVVNPTSSQPVVPSDDGSSDPNGERPKPLKIEDVLARREPVFSPLPGADDGGANAAPAAAPAAPGAATSDTADDAGPTAPTDTSGSVPRPAPTRAALPSFSDIVAAGTGSTPAVSGAPSADLPAATSPWALDDALVKPIEEKPPVARETDPLVSGLAELIVKATPSNGTPRVEPLAAPPVSGPTDVVAAPVAPPPAPPTPPPAPVVQAPVPPPPVVAAPTPAPTPVPPPPPRVTGAQPVTPGSAVEAELNRLAYLPDQEEDVGPVEVPEIAYSDLRAADPVVTTGPVLSQGELYQPRQSGATVRHNSYAELMTGSMPVTRRRKRHFFRRVVTMLILLGMVGGGLFAVKYFVLDKVKWTSDIEPLANEVAASRQLSFDHSVDVISLPAGQYAEKLAAAQLGLDGASLPTVSSTWRALGLASGVVDPMAVGLTAMAESPAFYDEAADTIYVVEGIDAELWEFSLHRALTMTLLDQNFHWSDRLESQGPAVVRGTRALFDADSLSVALDLLDDTSRAAVVQQLGAIAGTFRIPATNTAFATMSASRLGVALWPWFATMSEAQKDIVEKDAVVTDADVLDLRRMVAGPAPATALATTEGALFWYHVLASRVDDDLAFKAILGWQRDDLTASTNASGASCVEAGVVFDKDHAGLGSMAFAAWANAAPPESATQLTTEPTADGGVRISIAACDPGTGVATNDGTPVLSLGGAPLKAAQFEALFNAQPSLTPAQVACAVYGEDTVTIADERPLVDPVDPWPALAAHPTPDPAAVSCTLT